MLEGGADIRYIQQMLGHADSTPRRFTRRCRSASCNKSTRPRIPARRWTAKHAVCARNTGPDDDEQKTELAGGT